MIDKSDIERVIFYYYSEGETKKGLSVHQEVEYKSVQELWKQLKALPQKYSCNYHIPKSDKVWITQVEDESKIEEYIVRYMVSNIRMVEDNKKYELNSSV